MKEPNTMATKIEPRTNPGVVPGVAHLALEIADRSQSTALAVLQDARTELRTVVDSGIELAEKATASLFRFAKKLTSRIDDGVAETLTSTEKLLAGAVKSARATTRATTDLAHTVGAGLAGEKAVA